MTDPKKTPTAPQTESAPPPAEPPVRELEVDDVETEDGQDVKGGSIAVFGTHCWGNGNGGPTG
ncbi:MAG: hypothetical protein H6742_20335 [Alphaproteobacteria bacterium]|nr:hypothetical protein [Alphaproteobacteria bacterium]